MVRSESPHLADAPALEEPPSRASPESLPRTDTTKHRRNGVPIDKGHRLHLELPVRVYSASPNQEPEPVREVARTLVLYARGALLEMDAPVKPGQKLLLVNPKTEAKAACRVAGFERKRNGSKPVVRVEFTQAAAKFWGVVFPSENCDPTERKLPRAIRRSSRIKCSQPMRVRPAEASGKRFEDAGRTQNVSHDGVYFHSRHRGYQKGMRLQITFPGHLDFFAPNINYTAEIVRVDPKPDGRVGVAVKVLGRDNAKPAHGMERRPALALGDVRHRLVRQIVRVAGWPVSVPAKLWRLTARQAEELVQRLRTQFAQMQSEVERFSEEHLPEPQPALDEAEEV